MKVRFLVQFLAMFPLLISAIAADNEEAAITKTSKLTIGGRLQTQYQYIDSNPYTNRLILRRARLTFQSKLNKRATIIVQMEAGMQEFTLKDRNSVTLDKKRKISLKMKAVVSKEFRILGIFGYF